MLDRVYEVTEGASWRDVASGLSRRLGKEALVAKVDGKLEDLEKEARPEEKVEFCTFAKAG
jgi:threonyl-tRNA synthetase